MAILTMLDRAELLSASMTPRSPAMLITKGSKISAIRRKAQSDSACKGPLILSACRTSQGVISPTHIAPTIPSANMSPRAVQTRGGMLVFVPRPRYSATRPFVSVPPESQVEETEG